MFITCPKCSVKYKIPSEISFNAGKKLQCSACQHIFEFLPENSEPETTKEDLVPPQDAVLTFTQKTERIVIQQEKDDKKETSLPEAFCPVKTLESQTKPPYLLIFICLVVLVLLAFGGWICRDLLWLDAMPEIHPVHYAKQPRKKVVHKEIVSPKVVKTENIEVDTSTDIPLSFEPEVQTKEVVSAPDVSETAVLDSVEQEQDDKASLSVGSVRFRKTESGDAFLLEGVLKNTTQNAVELPEKVYAIAYGAEGSVLFKKEIYLPRGMIQPGMEQAFFGTYAPIIKGVQWIDVVLKD